MHACPFQDRLRLACTFYLEVGRYNHAPLHPSLISSIFPSPSSRGGLTLDGVEAKGPSLGMGSSHLRMSRSEAQLRTATVYRSAYDSTVHGTACPHRFSVGST